MSNIIHKNDFNILLKQVENNKSSILINNALSWETTNFDKEFKIVNFTNDKLSLKIKNEIDCDINLDNLSCNCNNKEIFNLITKNLNSDLETCLNKINSSLKNFVIEKNDNCQQIWNPYEYLNTKKTYLFNINKLKEKAYKFSFSNLDIPKEHIIDTIFEEIKVLHDNNIELIFDEDNLFNFDVKLGEITINIDLTTFHYPYYPPLLGFYNTFNDNFENKIINSSFLKLENWSQLKTKNLLMIINYIKNIIDDNVIDVNEDFSKINSIICKINYLNEIKLYDTDDLDFDLEKLSNKWKFNFNNIRKNNIKSLIESRLFEELLNEVNDDINLSYIIEYYIEKYNLISLDNFYNYKIFNIIFSIIELTDYKIINLHKLSILKNEINEYDINTDDELFKKIINYDLSYTEIIENNDEYTNIMNQFLVNESEFKNFYFENYPCSSNNNKCINRIKKELICIKNLPLISYNSSIFITYDKEDCKKIMALITGPKGTPYEDGCFIFHILINDNYPNSAPQVYFETTYGSTIKFNPNLHNDGKVHLSLLGTNFEDRYSDNWDKDNSTLVDILLSIQNNIFVKEPLFVQAIYKNLELKEKGNELSYEYNKKIKKYTYEYAILDKLKNPNEEFKDVILNHFKLKKII